MKKKSSSEWGILLKIVIGDTSGRAITFENDRPITLVEFIQFVSTIKRIVKYGVVKDTFEFLMENLYD